MNTAIQRYFSYVHYNPSQIPIPNSNPKAPLPQIESFRRQVIVVTEANAALEYTAGESPKRKNLLHHYHDVDRSGLFDVCRDFCSKDVEVGTDIRELCIVELFVVSLLRARGFGSLIHVSRLGL